MVGKMSVSIVIPAFKEEGNIEAAIDNAVMVAQGLALDYELIVIDDGSTDKTAEYARLKANQNDRIRVASNATNQGFGYSFSRGVKMAVKEYVTVFPGDNDMAANSLRDLLQAMGSAPLVVSYMKPTNKRSLFRRLVSKAFVVLMNTLFGLNLKYYNGAFICKRDLLQTIDIKSTGLAALAECLVRLINRGIAYRWIYFEHAGRRFEQSKAFNVKSIQAVLTTIIFLVRDIYLNPHSKT
jgi:glycosyltransferase involved in cell wall biosynthesis